jgi:hypothetical protein
MINFILTSIFVVAFLIYLIAFIMLIQGAITALRIRKLRKEIDELE